MGGVDLSVIILIAIMFLGIMMMFKEMLIEKNRRENRISKKLQKKLKRIFTRQIIVT